MFLIKSVNGNDRAKWVKQAADHRAGVEDVANPHNLGGTMQLARTKGVVVALSAGVRRYGAGEHNQPITGESIADVRYFAGRHTVDDVQRSRSGALK